MVIPSFADKTSKTGNIEELSAGTVRNSVIDLNNGFGTPSKSFSFRVPKNAYAVRLTVSGAPVDLDLFVNYGSKIEDYSSADYSSESEQYNESIFITRQSDIPLETGVYYVSAAYQYDYLPMVEGKRVEEINYSISYEIIKAEAELVLVPGKAETIVLKPERGMFAAAAVDIPYGTDNFRIDVFDTNADIDIFTALKSPAKSRSEALYAGESMLGAESLVISSYTDSKLLTGRYYISFLDQLAKDLPQSLSVIVTLGTEVPEELTGLPVFPEPFNSFDTALLSTVEIISENGKGSGCLVSRNGFVVTNWHVIAGQDGKPSDENYVAVSLSSYVPPEELFSAEVVEYNVDLDLALLRISAGRYGQPLPYGYEFPYFSLGEPDKLRIGQPLGIIGYPEVGGTGSRTSITFTSGIVSGFEAAAECNLIKTDALISSGNSGGAVIDAYNELLGFPAYIMDINNNKMGYIYPVTCLPYSWLSRIERANR